jgi:hypothetical protein
VLITLALAVVTALNLAWLCSLRLNHAAVGARSAASATNPLFKAIAGEPASDLYFFRPPGRKRLIVLAGRAGASASLRFAADGSGIGGDPVISYLRNSRSGPVLLLSGFPAGTATRFLRISAGQSCRNCSAVSYWSYPFPSGGEQVSPGMTICIARGTGRIMLRTIPDQSSGQIGVIIIWFPDLAST